MHVASGAMYIPPPWPPESGQKRRKKTGKEQTAAEKVQDKGPLADDVESGREEEAGCRPWEE